MLYEKKYYEPTSYRNSVIDVLSKQHELLSVDAPSRSHWARFDDEYLERLMHVLTIAIFENKQK